MKKIAILLVLALCMTVFAGCSSAEIGYVNVVKESNGMDKIHHEGTVEVFYDAALIKPYLIKALSLDSWESPEEIEAGLKDFTGSKKIKLDFVVDGDKSEALSKKIMIDLNATIDDVRYPVGKIYVSDVQGIYLDKQVAWNLYQIADKLIPSKDVPPEAYLTAIKNILNTEGVVELVGSEMEDLEDYLSIVQVATTNETMLYDAAYQFVFDAFKGYSTGAVSQTAGGYRIYLTGETLIKTAGQMLDYMMANVDSIYSASLELQKKIAVALGENLEYDSDRKLSASEKSSMVGTLTTVKVYIDELYKEGSLDFMKPISYEKTVQKVGSTYVCKDNLDMTVGGKKAAYLKSDITVSKGNGVTGFPKSGTSVETLIESCMEVEQLYNPVKSVVLEWEKEEWDNCGDWEYEYEYGYDYDYFWPDITYQRQYDWLSSAAEEYSYTNGIMKDQQIYVPLRELAEGLGEKVGWDKDTNQSYVLKNDKKIIMTGIEDDDVMYVKVRDFEKLGYKVTYDGSDSDWDKVMITK